MKPVLTKMLKDGAKQEDVAKALQKAQKELVLGCQGCWESVKTDVLWVHAYVEAEKELLEAIERETGKASEISALCFLHKAAGIAVANDRAENFYGGTRKDEYGKDIHWGILVPQLMKIRKRERGRRWLTYVLAKQESPIVKIWQTPDGTLTSEPLLSVDQLYKCVFDEDNNNIYVHIGYPGRATKLASHVGPAGCYLLLKNQEAFEKLPPCLVLHLRAFVQTLVTAQLSVLATHLRRREASKVEELKKYKSMYNQLLSPLRSLTEAVHKTQEDAHEIAAIIHDPLDVLLGRQSAIAQLFIPHKVVEIPPLKESVEIAHNPSQYRNANHVAGVAALLLQQLIPQLARDLSANTSSELLKLMVGRLAEWSNDKTNAYFKFCVAFQGFLGTESWEIAGTRSVSNWSDAKTFLSADPNNVKTFAVEFLSSAKDRFFKLYKPDEADEALSWEVMRAYLCTINTTSMSFLAPSTELSTEVILPRRANPLNTHGHLVAFIGRVVAQHVAYNKLHANDITFSSCNDGVTTTFAVTSTQAWLSNREQFVRFLNEQIGHREDGIRAAREFGDFHRPFVDLIQRIPIGVHAAACGDESRVRLGIGELVFEFCACEFKMLTNGEVAP